MKRYVWEVIINFEKLFAIGEVVVGKESFLFFQNLTRAIDNVRIIMHQIIDERNGSEFESSKWEYQLIFIVDQSDLVFLVLI
jgi:hypothetical protein